MLRRLPIAVILVAVLVASCGGSPGFDVSSAGGRIPTVLSSTTERTACSGTHGDAFPVAVPVTRAHAPVTLTLSGGSGMTGFRGWVYEDVDGMPSGEPIEAFTVTGRTGTHTLRSTLAGRTYSVLVNAMWSFLVTNGEETRAFRVAVDPP